MLPSEPDQVFHQTTFGQTTISHSASWTRFISSVVLLQKQLLFLFSLYSLSRVVLRLYIKVET